MSNNVIELTEDTFDREMSGARGAVLVDFWADGCAPCAALGPVLDDVARRSAGTVRIAKVNLSNAPTLAARFEIMTLPTLLLFVDGKPEQRITGVENANHLLQQLKESLGSALVGGGRDVEDA
jgi:thioredoxin 1